MGTERYDGIPERYHLLLDEMLHALWAMKEDERLAMLARLRENFCDGCGAADAACPCQNDE